MNFFVCFVLFGFCSTFASIIHRTARDAQQADFSNCKEGEILKMGNAKFICKNGQPEPSACIGPEVLHNEEIPINSTKTIDGMTVKCSQEGNTIKLSAESAGGCFHGNRTLKEGETAKSNNFILKCINNRILPVGCYFNDKSGKEITSEVGQTVLIDGVQNVCGGLSGPGANKFGNATVTGPPLCIHNGKSYKSGEKWEAESGFMYQCVVDGGMSMVNVTDCILEPGKTIAVGESKIVDGWFNKCFRDSAGVRFVVLKCGQSVVCEGVDTGKLISPSQQNIQGQNGTVETNVQTGQATQCTKNGKQHALGEVWKENGFKYICQNDGRVNITACIADDGTEIAIGETIVKDRLQHICKLKFSGVIYMAQVCGAQIECGDKQNTTKSPM